MWQSVKQRHRGGVAGGFKCYDAHDCCATVTVKVARVHAPCKIVKRRDSITVNVIAIVTVIAVSVVADVQPRTQDTIAGYGANIAS
jgi:hypothetical protein